MTTTVVADTGAILALIDRDDRHHAAMTRCLESDNLRWVLPWAVLPEVDYLVARQLGARVHDAWLKDLSDGLWDVEGMDENDLAMAAEWHQRHKSVRMGLVDAVVAVVAQRLHARAIATLDLRHFGAVKLPQSMQLWPRDLA
jgi:hypothetical protein